MKRINLSWKPGFATRQEAIKAGEKWFAKANGHSGRLGRDFHIVENEHGRFHFEEGRAVILRTETQNG